MAIVPRRNQRVAAGDHEAHAGYAFEALARRRHQGIQGNFAHVNRDDAIGAHRVDNQAPPPRGDHAGDFRQRVEDAGAGLAVHLRDMRDCRVRRQSGIDARRIGRLVLAVCQRDTFAAKVVKDAQDALAICAVVRDENLAVPRHQSPERGLDGKGAAALQGHAGVGVFPADYRHQFPADGRCQRIEGSVP